MLHARVILFVKHCGSKKKFIKKDFNWRILYLESGLAVKVKIKRYDRIQRIGASPFPIVEIPDKMDPARIRGPFPENPGAVPFFVQSIIEMVVHSLRFA